MTATHSLAAHHDDAHGHGHAHEELGFLKKYVFSVDHKIIGIQFLFMGLFFFVVGGLLAMLIRWQLGWPGAEVPILSKLMGWTGGMPPDFYTMVFSMHATIMIFFVIIPLLVGTFGNYLIPLKIGAGDMAFPFLNGLAFWSALPAGTIMLAGFNLAGGAAAAGWTSYPPLSAVMMNSGVGSFTANLLRPEFSTWPMFPIITNLIAAFMFAGFVCAYFIRFGNKFANAAVSIVLSAIFAVVSVRFVQQAAFDGQACWFLSLFLLGFSSLMGAVNYLTTMIKLRCPGMTMFRMPLSVWSLFITSLLVLLATPVLASTLMMNLLDHHRFTSFFLPYNHVFSNTSTNNSGGGYVLLHQHLFWFYSHPAVYIMILPAMGMVSDVISVFSRKPIFGYRPMVYAMAGIAFLGFIVWAHHMFQSGMNPTLGTTFAVSTMFIAVPSAIKTFNWLGTLWGGNIRFTVAMWNAIAFVSMFVIGGLSGIFMASTAVDVHIHDTYFIVAHIHYVLFGGSTFGIFAGIYFWYPKMFGRMMNETLGHIHFWLSFIAFNCTFFAMHILGIGGFPRRVADYLNYQSFAPYKEMNEFISYSAFALGLAQIPFVINFIGSWIWGKRAPQNPWEATTLEWHDAPTPPPHGNFATVPVVHHGPYEYSSPLVEEDWLPQTRYVEGAEKLVVKH
ncbi:MAG TPA: cbb3-type cytochrome c oxidase subunit I [Tepidisphaeraceae bacterium]|nr:cbb3-type cytochrome c oxidase subunit I [Tepidisphaeraceae bacterium]